MRIALVTEYLSSPGRAFYGGVDARTKYIAERLQKEHEITIICSFQGFERVEDFQGYKIVRVGKPSVVTQRGHLLRRYNFIRAVSRELQKGRFDIVDASGFVAYPGAYKGASKFGVPTVATVHEVWRGHWVRNMGLICGFLGHFLEKKYLKYPFSAYIAVSNCTKKRLVKELGIPEGKISVIYNGVDQALFDSVAVHHKFEDPTIISVGRLVRYKGFDTLLMALARLKADMPQAKLKIVGEGPERGRLEILARKLHLERDVEFLGKIDDMRRYVRIMKMSHVFALPSIMEGFGMVFIEAMACGLPFVGADIEVLREVTNNGEGGFLCNPGDAIDLKEKIRRAFLIRRPSRPNLLRKFDWDIITSRITELYSTIIGS